MVGVGFIVWVLVAYEIPFYSYGRMLWPRTLFVPCKNFTFRFTDITPTRNLTVGPIKYNANITLTTVDDFLGDDNYIHMVAVFYNMNVPDILFPSLWSGVIFEYSAIPLKETVHYTANHPVFQQVGNGVWRAEGDIAFEHQINFTGPLLIATELTGQGMINMTKLYANFAPQIEAYHFPLTLQPKSFTDEL